ncbi:uncharacterized protein FIBRA_08195 [Fibroporia radiculosa]|uniref:Uncharacterized protein n=1 Tax=Fibroporia radiculosa TaxID=599839 RepID=J4IC82_9APHY|nr:uncharacterized protein FIBRA_08195 [Fibroporia radiculosa]CCM05956.1 predicted protein [Fibroporia radiculosa]
MAPKRPPYTRSSSSTSSGASTPTLPYASSMPHTPPASPTPPQAQLHGHTGLSTVVTVAHAEARVPATIASSSGSSSSKANLIGTLKSKSAYDALVHGSWA